MRRLTQKKIPKIIKRIAEMGYTSLVSYYNKVQIKL